jgi:ABC-2 type transport system ATP-binding protein
MLTVRSLSKTIEQQRVLQKVSFTLQPGQVVGVIGRNGAGKTTLFKTMAGVLIPDSGSVEYEGKSVHEHPRLKENVIFIPDSPEALFSYTTVESANLYAQIYPAFDREYYIEMLTRLELPLNRKIRQFSKGMRMMFSTVLGLSTRAQYILLDEPTNGIDAIAKKQVMTLLIEAAEEGKTLVISSHLLSELERIADTILIMKNGTIETHAMAEANGTIVKYQVVFQGDPPTKWLASRSVYVLENVGRVYTVLMDTEGKVNALSELSALQPLLMEQLPMKLEDLFVWKLGGNNHVG